MEQRKLAIKLVDIYRELDKFSKGLESIGLEGGSTYLDKGMGTLGETILDLLGVPEDETIKYDYGTPEYENAPCRDYWYDSFFGFFDEEAPAELLVDSILTELEEENGKQRDS